MAPQPLLIKLGALLSDITAATVYQLHREPAGWSWREEQSPISYNVNRPVDTSGTPALVFSLSATVVDERIFAVLPNASIWRISIDAPSNDFVRSLRHTEEFRRAVRTVLDLIKAAHGQQKPIHVFPAMPLSLAVETGRVWMPKADLPLLVYDENREAGGFRMALEIH